MLLDDIYMLWVQILVMKRWKILQKEHFFVFLGQRGFLNNKKAKKQKKTQLF